MRRPTRCPMRLLAASAALLLGACSFRGELADGYRCGDGDRCPAGQQCVAGYCVAEPADGGGGDAGEVDGGGTSVCGSLWLLRDDFEDGSPFPLFDPFDDPGVTVSESGGELRIALAAGSGDIYGGYESVYQYDLTEGGFEAEVAQPGGINTIVEVRGHLDERAQLVLENGQIAARVFGTASPGQRAQLTYDPGWVYWRIRVGTGVMHWEVSADRATWTEIHAEATPFDVAHVRGILAAGGQGPTPSTARFASVNTTAPTNPGFCGVDTLVDDFAAAPLAPLWFGYTNGDCTVVESGGELVMAFGGNGNQFCGLVARHLHDVTGGAVIVDSAGVPTRTNFVTYLQFVSLLTGETRIELSNDSGTLYAVRRIDGVPDPVVGSTYDPVNDRYWRLRGVGTQVELATAPATTGPWTVRLIAATGFALDAAVVNLGAGHYATVSPAGTVTVRVPGLNAP